MTARSVSTAIYVCGFELYGGRVRQTNASGQESVPEWQQVDGVVVNHAMKEFVVEAQAIVAMCNILCVVFLLRP